MVVLGTLGASGWCKTWGFPKTRGTILGVFIIRTSVFGGLYWGPTILGNYHSLHQEFSSFSLFSSQFSKSRTTLLWRA